MVSIRRMKNGEEEEIYFLIKRVFDEFEAPDYPKEGVENFYNYINPSSIQERHRENHFMLLAINSETKEIVGVIEMRTYNHICLLFVDKKHQRKGVGKVLFQSGKEICLQENPTVREITVNSSPYALKIYEKLGFTATSDEQLVDGLRFIPMIFEIQ